MVKVKQVATKKPRYGAYIADIPLRKAIKTATSFGSDLKVDYFGKKNRAEEIIASVKKFKKLRLIAETTGEEEGENNNLSQGNKKPRFSLFSIPRRPFQSLVKIIAQVYMRDCRFSFDALEALQLATEDFMVGFFEDASICMRHAGRKTLQLKDIALAGRLRRVDYEPL